MANTVSSTRVSIFRLILIPSLITLAVTGLRLVGELNQWSKGLFDPTAGGGGPSSAGRAILFAVLGAAVVIVGAVIAIRLGFYARLLFFNAIVAIAAALQYKPWPKLFKTLLAYGYAARIPVAIVMLFAIMGNWGTHYDVPPPGAPEEINNALWSKYFWIGLMPQLVVWVGFTIVAGSLFGSVAAAIAGRRKPASQAAAGV
jgi:hypothetical protein